MSSVCWMRLSIEVRWFSKAALWAMNLPSASDARAASSSLNHFIKEVVLLRGGGAEVVADDGVMVVVVVAVVVVVVVEVSSKDPGLVGGVAMTVVGSVAPRSFLGSGWRVQTAERVSIACC